MRSSRGKGPSSSASAVLPRVHVAVVLAAATAFCVVLGHADDAIGEPAPQSHDPGPDAAVVTAAPRTIGFETANFLPLDPCPTLAHRLSKVRELLKAAPASTPRDAHPHAILIWFRTSAPGVDILPSERSKAPNDMSIILQNQYRNLIVTADTIEVTVRFKGVWHTVVIPTAALIMVLDRTAGIKIDLRRCD